MFRNISLVLVVSLLATLGCTIFHKTDKNLTDTLIRASSKKRPDWLEKGVWEEEGHLYAVGISLKFPAEKSARGDAEKDAMARMAKYVKQNISTEEKALKSVTLTNFRSKGFYTEKWRTSEGEIFWKAYVLILCKV